MIYCFCPCSDCIFNILGDCNISDVYVHYNNLDKFPAEIDSCNIKLTRADVSNSISDDYFLRIQSSDKSSTQLCFLLEFISNYKNSTKEEN